jgi:hypothetical protein
MEKMRLRRTDLVMKNGSSTRYTYHHAKYEHTYHTTLKKMYTLILPAVRIRSSSSVTGESAHGCVLWDRGYLLVPETASTESMMETTVQTKATIAHTSSHQNRRILNRNPSRKNVRITARHWTTMNATETGPPGLSKICNTDEHSLEIASWSTGMPNIRKVLGLHIPQLGLMVVIRHQG